MVQMFQCFAQARTAFGFAEAGQVCARIQRQREITPWLRTRWINLGHAAEQVDCAVDISIAHQALADGTAGFAWGGMFWCIWGFKP